MELISADKFSGHSRQLVHKHKTRIMQFDARSNNSDWARRKGHSYTPWAVALGADCDEKAQVAQLSSQAVVTQL